MSDKTLSASAAGASYLIFLQVLSRALTFALNQVLLRFLSPELLGVSAQLELYSISVLYFARESIRVAVQRQSQGVQTVVNLSYLAIGSGIPLAWGFAWLYLKAEVPQVPYFKQSLVIYAFASVVELASEPAFVVAQQKLLYKIRASAEGTATIAKCLVTVGSAVWANSFGHDIGVFPFAFGQMAFAYVLLLVYVARIYNTLAAEKLSLLPAKLPADEAKAEAPYLGLFSKPLTNLSISLTLQSTLKYFLTQSDGFIVAACASLADQGAYALASNYGGLVARMLFQPIEEAGRNLFARLCAPEAQADADTNTKKPPSKSPTTKTEDANTKQAADILTTILHLYSVLSLLAVTLGPSLSPLLLTFVAGRRWAATTAPEVLAAYCYYIPLLAYNGIIEAFVSAVATPSDLRSQSMWMTAFSAVFASTAYALLGVYSWGAKGVVAANCVNMTLRILWGSIFIDNWFKARNQRFSIWDARPKGLSIASAVAAYALLRALPQVIGEPLWMQLGKAGGIASAYGLSLLFAERAFLTQCYQLLRPQR